MISRVADPSPSPLPRLPQWMNDIEKDRRYDGISSHLQNLFPVNYFGMLMESGTLVPQYRKNLFHLVAFLDVSNPLSGNVCEGLREILELKVNLDLEVILEEREGLDFLDQMAHQAKQEKEELKEVLVLEAFKG